MNYSGLKWIQKVHGLLERVTIVQSAKTGVQESAEKLTELRTVFKSVTAPAAERALAQECCLGTGLQTDGVHILSIFPFFFLQVKMSDFV